MGPICNYSPRLSGTDLFLTFSSQRQRDPKACRNFHQFVLYRWEFFLCIHRPCRLQPRFVPLVLDFRLVTCKQAILFTRPMLVSRKNFFKLMSRNLQLQNSKAKVRIIHQQIHWLLISDKGIFEYVKNFHCVPAYLYLSKTVIMVFRVYPETWRFLYCILLYFLVV